ncbi:glycosyltransferase family 2 protein [Rhodoligotrophos defluvii]|uniref:glycosyltransferase family 2 protein n=1 Tax=Rhodoligotrophos defluvii TaxID=2561934 RepID=UPI0010C9C5AD|nr:glycosyltransferase family 2 protein [Rhodoligotrophos defluvii]
MASSRATSVDALPWHTGLAHIHPDQHLSDLLLARGWITGRDLRIAQELAAAADEPLGRVLIAEGLVDQSTLAAALADVTGLPRTSSAELHAALARLSAETVQDVLLTGYLPLCLGDSGPLYATADPAPWRGAEMGMPVAGLMTADELRAACLHVWGGALLHHARDRLADSLPQYSARRRLSRGQIAAALALLIAAGVSLWLAPPAAMLAAAVLLCTVFLSVIALKGLALIADRPAHHVAPDARLPDSELPVYSILVPAFREAEVLPHLIDALLALDYPAAKLDIKIILEREDWETRCALAKMSLPGCFETVVVPKLMPQTKPKALNYAMRFVRGTYLVIYDAEDRPEPDQLRQAVARFAQEPDDVACLQARLSYFNHGENWLTRQFTIEYAALFDLLLPVLARFGLPLPLGGTSNHFRVDVLRAVHAWDPFNVTEDADLGLRFARLGYRVGVIASTTYEEANCRLGNWLRQRSRWIKGWMQTWLVHMRAPGLLLRELGWRGFITFQAVTAGIVLSGLLHPLCVGVLLWKAVTVDPLAVQLTPLEWLLAGLGTIVFVSGLVVALASGMVALGHRPELLYLRRSLLTMPVYWLLISAGAWYALWELVRRPFHWQKTRHGLSRQARHHQTAGHKRGRASPRGAAETQLVPTGR